MAGKKKSTGVTVTEAQTTTRTETMTHEEERVVRMLHGLNEAGDTPLEFAEGQSEEVQARLMRMEAMLMAQMHGKGPLAESGDASKAKILSRLQSLEDE